LIKIKSGWYIPMLGYIRSAGTVADKRNIDQDIFCRHHSRKPLVTGWRSATRRFLLV